MPIEQPNEIEGSREICARCPHHLNQYQVFDLDSERYLVEIRRKSCNNEYRTNVCARLEVMPKIKSTLFVNEQCAFYAEHYLLSLKNKRQ